MYNRIIERMQTMATPDEVESVDLDDIKSVVANCFLDCISDTIEYSEVLNYIKRNKLSLQKFEKSTNYQEMVLVNCFLENGGIGIMIEELSQQHPDINITWDNETEEKIQDIIEESSEYASKSLTTVMSTVIYDVIEAA